ncbi:hypothetical protein C8J57DRAFT_1236940 [Mycena rebaudengoi]|nr:hypothetical protein C8J57DRAFT_1236940 [Mycena rebaudengoi]
MKTEHAAVKKPRILQDIAGAEQADIAELGQKGTVNEDGGNNPQCVAQHEAAHRCAFGQDGDSLIDLYLFLRHTTVPDLAPYASERDRQCIIFCCGTLAGLGSNLLCDSTTWTATRSSVEENGERLHDSCGAVGIEIALRKALWRKHHDGDNT